VDTAKLFGGGSDSTKLANPISSEMSHMRPSLLGGLLQAAARNQSRGFMDFALFEVGPVFHGGEPEDQENLITGLLVGQTEPRSTHGTRRGVDLYDAKSDAEGVLAAIGAPKKLMVQRGVNPWWHPGRAAKFSLGPKNILGAFGELNPRVLDAMNVKGPAVAFAIHIENVPLPKARGATRPALSISDFQAVERDFAFVVDHDVEAETILNAVRGADKALIADASTFDQFTGEKAETRWAPARNPSRSRFVCNHATPR